MRIFIDTFLLLFFLQLLLGIIGFMSPFCFFLSFNLPTASGGDHNGNKTSSLH